MLFPSLNVIGMGANNTPQIMLLLHVQIRRYFNKICDDAKYYMKKNDNNYAQDKQ